MRHTINIEITEKGVGCSLFRDAMNIVSELPKEGKQLEDQVRELGQKIGAVLYASAAIQESLEKAAESVAKKGNQKASLLLRGIRESLMEAIVSTIVEASKKDGTDTRGFISRLTEE